MVRRQPPTVELDASALDAVRNSQLQDYRSANVVLESLKKLIAALSGKEKRRSPENSNVDGSFKHNSKLRSQAIDFDTTVLECRNSFKVRTREVQNGVYPYNTMQTMTEEQIRMSNKIREALHAGRNSSHYRGADAVAYKSLHELLSTRGARAPSPIQNVLFELLDKLLSFDHVEVDYKKNLQQILDELMSK